MTNRIQCQGLGKRFGSVTALQALDLDIDLSEPTGLVGANGAGKSTLFAILCGFIRPSAGSVQVMGMDVRQPGLKGKLGILPQDTSMYKGISVHAQLCHYARLQGFNRHQARQEVGATMERVNALSLARQYPETLSFGQRKKVLLAQALIGSPRLILLDEPTSGLDPVVTREVHQLLQELAKDYCLFISSHNIDEIEGICRNIVVLNHGKLIRSGTISDIKRMHQCFRLRLESSPAVDIIETLGAMPNVTAVEAEQGDTRRYMIFYREGSSHEVQIAVLNEMQKFDVGVEELSKGSALADEISSLLRG
ncbi:MAG: ABC transporter ATP-binding protein [Gammaproteobacteria bacterium]